MTSVVKERDPRRDILRYRLNCQVGGTLLVTLDCVYRKRSAGWLGGWRVDGSGVPALTWSSENLARHLLLVEGDGTTWTLI